MSFKIVSWYTTDTKYKDVINEFIIPSLVKLNIVPAIYSIPSLGIWLNNTNLKPLVAKKAIEEFKEDIVLLDADCTVNQYPKLFDEIPEEYDMAAFYLNWGDWYKNGSKKVELVSSTLFFKNRDVCKKLISSWENMCKTNTTFNDQKNLELAIQSVPEIKVYPLPYEYSWISSLPNGQEPHVKRPDNVVIELYQISRILRKDLNNGK